MLSLIVMYVCSSNLWCLISHIMDYIRKFDIELEKEHYYAGEKLKGHVIVENVENLKIRGL